MRKTLELQVVSMNGKTARITIDNPKEPVEEAVDGCDCCIKCILFDGWQSGLLSSS